MSPCIDLRAAVQASLAERPASNVYFLLDHGGLPDLHRQLKNSAVDWVSLFEGTNEANAVQVAPILVLAGSQGQVRMSRSLFTWIEKHGTYTSTILMLSSPLEIGAMKHRLAARLQASLSENMQAMLRFFDPRIFQSLLHVLSPEQLAGFLAPAETWCYVDRAGKLVGVEATFNPAEGSTVPLELSAKQEFDLIDASEADQVLALLRENAPDLMAKEPLPAQYDFVSTNIRSARSAGLDSIAELVVYNVVALSKGADFMKGATWSKLMDGVKSKAVDFTDAVSVLDIEEEWAKS